MALPRTRWTLLVLLLIGGPWGLYYLLARASEVERPQELNQLVLPALSLALIVLTLGLAGVLIRNLVRLIIERKRGILGTTLRMKLVFFFLALVLLPAIVLFTGSAKVIKQTVEAILRTPVERLTGGGRETVDAWREYFKGQALRRALDLAEEIRERDDLGADERKRLATLLERHGERDGLPLIEVVVGGRGTVASAETVLQPELRPELIAMVDTLAGQALASGERLTGFDRLGTGLVASAAVPIGPCASCETAGAPAVVAVALRVPERVADSLEGIDGAVRDYRQAKTKRGELVRFYLTLIGLVFIATLFVATWVGLYLARRITEPIRQLAAASREISAGNLGVRVDARVGDELGMLVDAFNDMAGELQENREVITRSTADLRHTNRALDERRRYIETLIANLSTAVVSLDPAGRVTMANPAVEQILGVSLAAGDDARAAFRRRGLDRLADLLERPPRVEDEGRRQDLELPGSAPTDHVSVRSSPLRGRSGEDLGRLIMVEDLTDLLRAQKVLAWHEVAQRIAHEIKNPLTPIQLAAQRLRKKFLARAADLDQVLLESTESIEREVAGLKQLVDEFSKFARLPELVPRPVEFGKVIDSVLALYRGLADIEWDVQLDPELGWVRVDVQQMRRVLINLIDNAVAAVEGRGTIRIGARCVGPGGALRIEVADSGPGIPPADRGKMFVPYFSTKRKGTGLGLALVHKVVADHGGTIRVEDNQPHGARFVIEIPA